MTLTRRLLLAGSTCALLPAPLRADVNLTNVLAPRPFGYSELEERARRLARQPHDPPGRRVPPAVSELDWDAWREIRFRPEASLLGPHGRLNLQAFHLGHLFKRPVRLNLVKGGVAEPIPYIAENFDYGGKRFDPPLPIDLGYAGWRMNYPLNRPGVWDELISFIGSSYFRLLGRGQVYGLSARGLSIGTGRLDNNEEFPFFREFWFQRPEEGADPKQDKIVFFALLDSPSVVGAYSFELHPGDISRIDVTTTLFARRRIDDIGISPLTSMFFIGENDRHYNDRNRYDDYRPEMHDSDGLRLHMADGHWIWRPLRNPQIQELSYYHTRDIRGFGLMQRDRTFSNYQDIDLAYQNRPSYWIEPKGDWGAGRIELVELATRDETADNIVVAWLPAEPLEPEKPATYAYSLHAGLDFSHLSSLGRVCHTFNAPVGALGSYREQKHFGARRFIVDFAGGDLAAHQGHPEALKIDATVSGGKVIRTFATANPQLPGVRTILDVKGIPADTIHMNLALSAGGVPVTETWSYRWKVE